MLSASALMSAYTGVACEDKTEDETRGAAAENERVQETLVRD